MPRSAPSDRFQELLEAATAVFLEQGYRRTQMADVAARMGVAKGTVYLYVESKEALFDAVVRHADGVGRIEPPARLPIPTPPPGATLQMVERRVAAGAALPNLARALGRRRVRDVRDELDSILRELYGVLARQRTVIKLLDRCAHDYAELAAIWYRVGRIGVLDLLTRYLRDRSRRKRLRPYPDASVAARIVLETLVFWAVHAHWDPSPQPVGEAVAEQTAVLFLTRALCEESAP